MENYGTWRIMKQEIFHKRPKKIMKQSISTLARMHKESDKARRKADLPFPDINDKITGEAQRIGGKESE